MNSRAGIKLKQSKVRKSKIHKDYSLHNSKKGNRFPWVKYLSKLKMSVEITKQRYGKIWLLKQSICKLSKLSYTLLFDSPFQTGARNTSILMTKSVKHVEFDNMDS